MNELTTQKARPAPLSVFSDMESFDQGYRIARAMSSSQLVPATYQGEANVPNVMIAMDMASRVGVSPMVVMQNMHVIEGRPSWSSSFIISALNSCGLFSPLRFKLEKLGEREINYEAWEGPKGARNKVIKKRKINDMTCYAYAVEKETGEVLEGPTVSIGMAVAEGWYTKAGSKWVTMPDLMIRYRCAAFFGRLYAPHILNGMHTDDEIRDAGEMRDVTPLQPEPDATDEAKPEGRPKGIHAAMGKTAKDAKTKKPVKVIEVEADESQNNAGSVDNLQTGDGGEGDGGGDDNGDMFSAPGEDDDYVPA